MLPNFGGKKRCVSKNLRRKKKRRRKCFVEILAIKCVFPQGVNFFRERDKGKEIQFDSTSEKIKQPRRGFIRHHAMHMPKETGTVAFEVPEHWA